MKSRTIILIITLVALFSIGAIFMTRSSDSNEESLSDKNMSAQTQVEPNTVLIENFKFSTQNLTVKKGTTVTWQNKDTAKHDINFADESIADSELLNKDKTFQHTFDSLGEFEYSCTPHPFMKAKVTVIE